MAEIDSLLRTMFEKEGSDLHLAVGMPPRARISGSIEPIGDKVLTAAMLGRMLSEIVPEKRWAEFLEKKDLDLAHEIPVKILNLEQLEIPEAVKKLCLLTEGLVVVTGPTGSGKSTTLAAMIDYINRTRTDHIITIEDPIEFVHQDNKCL